MPKSQLKSQLKTDTYRHQLRSTLYVFLILALVIFSIEAMAAETASILPKKISRFRIVGIQTSPISDKLNSGGKLEPMSSGLNRSVTAKDMAAGNPQLQQLLAGVQKAEKLYPNSNYSSNLVTANMYSNFELKATQVMPCYEYGVSENLNLGIRIPIVNRSAQASFRASATNNASVAAKNLKNTPQAQPLIDGLNQLATVPFDTGYFTNELFLKKGYEAPRDFNKTAVGDIEIGTKYRFRKTDRMTSSLQTGLRIPTGKRPSRTNIFDTGTGNGTWAAGAYLFNDFYPTSRWTLGTAFKTIYNLPDRFQTAVPRDASDALPSNLPQDGQVKTVSRTSGMEYNGEISSTVKLFKNAVTPWIAYQWFQHGVDKYSGPGNLYYSGLEDGTDFTRHALEFGAGYSTVPAFAAKKAKIPYTIEALYNRTFAGRNTSYVSYVRVDLISYF